MSLATILLVGASLLAPFGESQAWKRFAKAPGSTEWNGAAEASGTLSWRTSLAMRQERGEPLVVTGRVFRPDGKTPASGVLIYVYHTDASGHYSRGEDQGNGRRHGKLRGWMLTGPDGRYELRTIRPAGYPGRPDPAHIHATLTAKDFPEHWIADFEFDDDDRLTAEKIRSARSRGSFSPVLDLTKRNGVWTGARDLKLEAPSRSNGGIWPQ